MDTPALEQSPGDASALLLFAPHLVLVLQQVSLLLLGVVQLPSLSVPLGAVVLLAGGGGVVGGDLARFRLGALRVWGTKCVNFVSNTSIKGALE